MKFANTAFTSTKFTNWKRIAKPLLVTTIASMTLAAGTAQAQIELTPEERQEFEQRLRNMSPEQRQQLQERLRNMPPEQLQQLIEQYRNMSPEERQRLHERFTQPQGGQPAVPGEEEGGWGQEVQISPEDRQKYLMRSAGIDDVAIQNAVIAYVTEQAKQRQGVTDAATELSNVLADKNASVAAINAASENLTAASRAFRDWKQGALATLDTRINYSKNPRLKSLLTLVGIIGDEAADAGGFNAIFPKGVAGKGDIMDFVPASRRNVGGGWGGRNYEPTEPTDPPGPED